MMHNVRVCPYCKEEIYTGDWFFEYWSGSFTCDDSECVIEHIELDEYAIDYCTENIGNFAEYIDLSRWLRGDWSVALSDILNKTHDDDLTLEFCRDSDSDFVDWLEAKRIITKERYIHEEI